MKYRLLLAVAAGLMNSCAAYAQWDNAIGISARQWTVREYNQAGNQLVREQGWLPGLEGRLAYKVGDWTAFGETSVFGGSVPYEGQTQFGNSVSSNTATKLAQVRVGASFALTRMFSAVSAFEIEGWDRDIKGAQNALGLRERAVTKRLLLGIDAQWRAAFGGNVKSEAAIIFAAPEHIQLDFGGVLDNASIMTKSSVGVRLSGAVRPQPDSPIEIRVAYDWIRVGSSDAFPVTSNGHFAGTVTQPEHIKNGITVGVRYYFN